MCHQYSLNIDRQSTLYQFIVADKRSEIRGFSSWKPITIRKSRQEEPRKKHMKRVMYVLQTTSSLRLTVVVLLAQFLKDLALRNLFVTFPCNFLHYLSFLSLTLNVAVISSFTTILQEDMGISQKKKKVKIAKRLSKAGAPR